MANDMFRFVNCETGEETTCKARQGALNRAKIYLFGGAEPRNNPEINMFMALWGFLSAEANGTPVVELPKSKRDMTHDRVLDLMDQVETYYEVNEDAQTDDGGEDTEGSTNPTEDAGELS